MLVLRGVCTRFFQQDAPFAKSASFILAVFDNCTWKGGNELSHEISYTLAFTSGPGQRTKKHRFKLVVDGIGGRLLGWIPFKIVEISFSRPALMMKKLKQLGYYRDGAVVRCLQRMR